MTFPKVTMWHLEELDHESISVYLLAHLSSKKLCLHFIRIYEYKNTMCQI